MSITLGNPIIITSGTMATRITPDTIDIAKAYWFQPTLESTSSLTIRKDTQAGVVFANMKCETSGQSQTLDFSNMNNWKRPFVDCVPTGTLYLHLK
jgi:hypothetical protein